MSQLCQVRFVAIAAPGAIKEIRDLRESLEEKQVVDSSLKCNFEECEPQAPKAQNMLARGKCERSEARRPWIDASKAASTESAK